MLELTFSQKFSLIALNAQDSLSLTTAKKVSLRCMAAAAIAELYLDNDFLFQGDILNITSDYIESSSINNYQKVVLEAFLNKKKDLNDTLEHYLGKVTEISNKNLKKIEEAFVHSLKEVDAIEEIPNLLGCDLYYTTAGVSIKEYRSNEDLYSRSVESIRAEILEDWSMTDENIFMLLLLRESGCIHDIFSKEELKRVFDRMNEVYENNLLAKKIFTIVMHKSLESSVKNFLKLKKEVMSTSVGTGFNFVFPFIERSQSVFIDTEAAFSKQGDRLYDVITRLAKNNHKFTVLREGAVPLIKIDNLIYEAVPAMEGRVCGVRLRRYPLY